MSIKSRLFAITLFLIAPTAFACDQVAFDHARIAATPGNVAAAYVTLTSTPGDTLTSVTSNCCTAVEIHESRMDAGVMKMRKLESLPLPAGKEVALDESMLGEASYHLMLIGPKKPLKKGDAVKLTFHFAKTPKHTVTFRVGEEAPAGDHSHHHTM